MSYSDGLPGVELFISLFKGENQKRSEKGLRNLNIPPFCRVIIMIITLGPWLIPKNKLTQSTRFSYFNPQKDAGKKHPIGLTEDSLVLF